MCFMNQSHNVFIEGLDWNSLGSISIMIWGSRTKEDRKAFKDKNTPETKSTWKNPFPSLRDLQLFSEKPQRGPADPFWFIAEVKNEKLKSPERFSQVSSGSRAHWEAMVTPQ